MDAIIATNLNHGLKSCASGFALSATECSTPELRNLLAQASQEAIKRQEQLYYLMEQRGWYNAVKAHQEDIQSVLPQLKALTQGTPVTV